MAAGLFSIHHWTIVIGEFNLQVQQLNSFSLRRERDVYSYERTPSDLAPLGAKPGSGAFATADKAIALLRSWG